MFVYADATFSVTYKAWAAVVSEWGRYRRLSAGPLPESVATSVEAEAEGLRRAAKIARKRFPGREIVVIGDCRPATEMVGATWESRESPGMRAAHNAIPFPRETVLVQGFCPTLEKRKRRR